MCNETSVKQPMPKEAVHFVNLPFSCVNDGQKFSSKQFPLMSFEDFSVSTLESMFLFFLISISYTYSH